MNGRTKPRGAGTGAGNGGEGIRLSEPRASAPDPSAPESFLLFAPALLLGMFGAASCFYSVFHLEVDVRGIIPFIAGISVGATALFLSRHYRILLIALAGAAAAVCLLLWERLHELLLRGAVYTFNAMILMYGGKANIDFSPLPVEQAGEGDVRAATTVFAIAVLLVVALLLAWLLIRKHSAFFCFLLTVPFPAAALAYTLIPDFAALLLIGLFWCFLLLCIAPLRARGRFVAKRSRSGGARRIYLAGGWSALRASALLIIPLMALFLLATALVFPGETYKRLPITNELRSDLLSGQIGFSLFGGGGVAGNTNRVDLRHVGSLRYRNETVIRVKSAKTTPDYLKGFVGSVYTGTGWEQLPDTYAEELTELTAAARPQNYAATLYRLFGYDEVGEAEWFRGYSYEVTVENVKMNPRCVYAPYGLSSTPGALAEIEFVADGFLRSANRWLGTDRYTLDAVFSPLISTYYEFFENIGEARDFGLSQEFLDLLTPEPRAFFESQMRYSKFAHEHYTELPGDVKAAMMEYLAGHGLDPAEYDGSTAEFVLEVIWQVQSENAYTRSPGVTPAGRDFIEYFLNENHKGYCVHFATAVTALLRAAGIPARYVEGFVVSPEDPKTEDGWVNIADNRAHAWVEIYSVGGGGWLPVEATPSTQSGVTVPREAGALGIPLSEAPAPAGTDSASPGAVTGAAAGAASGAAVADGSASGGGVSGGAAEASGGGAGGAAGSGVALPAAVRGALIALTIAAVAVLLTLAARLARRRRISRRERSFNYANRAKAVLAAYAYIERLMIFTGEEGKPAEGREAVLPPELMDTVLEARFGGKAPTAEALDRLLAYANELSQRAQKDASAFRLLLGRYVYGLF
jgi:hypothetical protein